MMWVLDEPRKTLCFVTVKDMKIPLSSDAGDVFLAGS
jgi:hypothetical protein